MERDSDGNYYHDGILLRMTCSACPEQYDALDGRGRQVGYLRLRHGRFSVECPDVGGELVLEVRPGGDGIFEHDEREAYLLRAIEEIKLWKRRTGC